MESVHRDRGIQLLELGRTKDAITYFKKAITEDHQDWTSKFYLAICYLNEKQLDEAEAISDSLLHDTPNDANIFYLKAKIKLQQDDFSESQKFIDMAIAINPYDADYFGLKAGLLLQKKKFNEGLAAVSEGLKIDAKNAYCLNLRAQILTKLNRIPEANQTVEDILYDNPEDSYSHANVGWVELENGNHKKALEHFKQALQFDPNFEYAREGMTTALKSKNPIYRWYLKYSFWMAKQSSKNQWVFIIGLYVAYRVAVSLLDSAGLSYVAIPLIVAYLLFALGGWIMEPLSNTILNFDKYGKFLLNKNEKISGMVFGGLALLGLISITLFYAFGIQYGLTLGIAFICALIPLPGALLLQKKKPRIFGIAYGCAMILVALICPLFTTLLFTQLAVFIMMVAYTWIGNIGK
ncbi:tetratricopeptide repeat protein [Cellulophaga sp. E16_2]|uniref:Tetratricopeptide TPR_1 repeat-containing protein n=1 Tax=Cellulophaga algicola (strain DSM 14237 / IC166 / ACAM 630) TaxID=688270 RepID=E6XBU1_CELAD|nr:MULTISPECIES: tetratricopeptide repeat protein [Cellulophaga]ADV48943.1 Tetratricopeptide TPR_1 repeat-containing protein [Cellulophaga algicola DSM 14237]MBO0591414.1 tetratricopeptide repeat protein [Cellulophaga sp. E16_2]